MNSINFDNVWLLFIAIPIIALVSVPFAIAVRSDNRNGHNIASLVLHILMAVLIAFAAAGTSVVAVVTKTQVFVVADVSYSAHRNLDTVDGYIKDLQGNLPRNSEMGLICFAKTPVTVTELGGKIESVRTALNENNPDRVDESETDIVTALRYAADKFSADAIKRVVLVTDGRQSDLRDGNSLKSVADELALKGVKIDAIYLDDNIDLYGTDDGAAKVKEIQISNAEFTKNTFLNNDENRVTAYVYSSYSVSNQPITLYRDGVVLERKLVNLAVGPNSVSFNLPADEENVYDYQIKLEGLETGDDVCSYNNSYSFTQQVSGEVSVMLLTENVGNESYIRGLYGEECDFTSFVLGRDAENKIPVTVEQLSAYDEIVLADVDISKLKSGATFVDSLEKVVTVLGKNLITVGDLKIQTGNDPVLAKLDELLPVQYGRNDNDPKLYTLVVDTSRSMDFNSRLIMAKQAAKQLVSFLNPDDQVLLVEFNGDVRLAMDLTSAAKTQTISDAVDNLGGLQGTVIWKGLDRAYEEMKPLAARFSERQVMLITDGLSYSFEGENDKIENVVKDMAVSNIKLSVLDVGRGGGGSREDETAKKLQGYAGICKGDYFYAISPKDLQDVMFTEIKDSQMDLVINARARVTRNRRNDDVYENCEPESEEDYVNGLVNSRAKGGSITVFNAEYYKPEVEKYVTAPLYAFRDFSSGGRVSTYTSSLVKTGSDNWKNKNQFVKNVLKSNIPSEKISVPYTLETKTQGSFARLQLSPLIAYQNARATAEVVYGDGELQTFEMSANKEGFYLDIDVSELGKYSVKVNYYCNNGETPYSMETAINISYKSEYDAFANFDASDLYKMVGGNGKVSEDGKLTIENDPDEVGTYVYSLIMPIMIACAVLFVADVTVRKLKWADIKNLFVKVGKNKSNGKEKRL